MTWQGAWMDEWFDWKNGLNLVLNSNLIESEAQSQPDDPSIRIS